MAELCVIATCLGVRDRVVSRPSFDRRRAWELVRLGFPVGASAVVYWAYLQVGSAAVAMASGGLVLGFYAFAVAPVVVMARAIATTDAIVSPNLWDSMARDDGSRQWVAQIGRASCRERVCQYV